MHRLWFVRYPDGRAYAFLAEEQPERPPGAELFLLGETELSYLSAARDCRGLEELLRRDRYER